MSTLTRGGGRAVAHSDRPLKPPYAGHEEVFLCLICGRWRRTRDEVAEYGICTQHDQRERDAYAEWEDRRRSSDGMLSTVVALGGDKPGWHYSDHEFPRPVPTAMFRDQSWRPLS